MTTGWWLGVHGYMTKRKPPFWWRGDEDWFTRRNAAKLTSCLAAHHQLLEQFRCFASGKCLGLLPRKMKGVNWWEWWSYQWKHGDIVKMIVFTYKHKVKVVATGENDGFTNRILKFSGVEVGTGWQKCGAYESPPRSSGLVLTFYWPSRFHLTQCL